MPRNHSWKLLVWKQSDACRFITAFNYGTGTVMMFHQDDRGHVREVSDLERLPDLRFLYVERWQKLCPVVRANIRAYCQAAAEGRYVPARLGCSGIQCPICETAPVNA